MLRSFRFSLVFLIIVAFLPFMALAQRSAFAVGTASAASGQKLTGYLEVCHRKPYSAVFGPT
jgi:hypothetical protein